MKYLHFKIHLCLVFGMVGSCNERMQKLKTRLDENDINRNGDQWNKAETPILDMKVIDFVQL